jgi:hypothetical protein
MATIEDAIYAKLAGDAPIAALVGTRIYRLKMPDNPQLPAITYETSYGVGVESFTGDSQLYMPIMRVHCWAERASVAQDMAIKVRAALLGYSGTYSGLTIHRVLEWSTTELFDPEIGIFHVAGTCRVWYS